jgi:hypothetical protein
LQAESFYPENMPENMPSINELAMRVIEEGSSETSLDSIESMFEGFLLLDALEDARGYLLRNLTQASEEGRQRLRISCSQIGLRFVLRNSVDATDNKRPLDRAELLLFTIELWPVNPHILDLFEAWIWDEMPEGQAMAWMNELVHQSKTPTSDFFRELAIFAREGSPLVKQRQISPVATQSLIKGLIGRAVSRGLLTESDGISRLKNLAAD